MGRNDCTNTFTAHNVQSVQEKKNPKVDRRHLFYELVFVANKTEFY